jgi:hypothetical protein
MRHEIKSLEKQKKLNIDELIIEIDLLTWVKR